MSIELDIVAHKVISSTMKLTPTTRVAGVYAKELMTLAGKVLSLCPNCHVTDWRGTCDLCALMTRSLPTCPFPSPGSAEWAWRQSQVWEKRWVHRWRSPFTHYWIAEDQVGYVVDTDARTKFLIAPELDLAQRMAEHMTRDEWENRR